MHFSDRLAKAIKAKNSCLMLGLDPNWDKLPQVLKTRDSLQQKADVYRQFCCDMTDSCAPFICGIKPQLSYFEVLGSIGIKALEDTLAHIRKNHPDIIILMDAKRGDIGSTSEAYAKTFLGDSPLAGDSVTVAPYMGTDSLEPFFHVAAQNDGGVFALVKTSNPSSSQLQGATLKNDKTVAEFWAENLNKIADLVGGGSNNSFTSVGAVVGATHGEELQKFRDLMPNVWILAPGVGAQGGKLEDVLKVRDKEGLGVLIPVSRSVLYAGNDENYLTAAEAEIKKLWEAQKV